jgi:Xaa-Pro aminopeptidase
MHFPDFERSEIESRQNRARLLMEKEKLDALLLTTEQNYRYLSGHRSLFWVSKTRPMFMVLPIDSDPVLLVAGAELGVARSTTWVDDLRTWTGWATEGVQALADVMREKRLDRGRIGAELGAEQRLGMPHLDFLLLRSSLHSEFIDASQILWKLRAKKSPSEVARHRKAANLAARAFKETFTELKVGMTEEEIYAQVGARMMTYGADNVAYLPLNSGPGNHERTTGAPTERKIQQGDLIWIDNCCPYRGYWTDFCRLVALGRATQTQKDYYSLIYDVMHKCIAAVKSGDPVSKLMQTCNQEFAKKGEKQSRAGRMGHSMGLDLTELPSITLEDHTQMEPNMVLAIEPNILNEHGFFQLEENVLVMETGYEILTDPAPPEMWII